MPPEITPGRSLWLRLFHVIEQREDHIHQVNSLIRRLGSHGILTDQYLLGPIIRFGTVEAGTSELSEPGCLPIRHPHASRFWRRSR